MGSMQQEIRKDNIKETILDDTLSLGRDGNIYYADGTVYQTPEKTTTRILKRN